MLKYSCFTHATGYGHAARNNIKALINLGIDLQLNPLDLGFYAKTLGLEDFKLFREYLKDVSPKYKVMHCIPTMQRRDKTKCQTIGYATFESDNPPDSWLEILNKNKYVLIPSQYNIGVFKNAGLKSKYFYLPHCVDFNIFNENVIPNTKYDKFTFLYLGTWKERKNIKNVIEAFLRAFKPEDARLVIKTSQIQSGSVYGEIKKISKKLNKEYSHINVNTSHLSNEEVSSFMKSHDCVINASLGEGFGLVGLQAMALCIPTILTKYSGQEDYVNEKTSHCLYVEGFKRSNMDNVLQFCNQQWPIISSEQIEKMMLQVREYNLIDLKYVQNFVREKFSLESIQEIWKSILDELEIPRKDG